jgi:hypothetical protein
MMSTTTQTVNPDAGAPERQHTRQHRWSERKRIGALVAAAVALVLIAALLIIQSREGAPATNQAEGVATRFLEAYGAFDVEQARTYLADDATIASMTERDDLRLLISYLEATGYQQILNDCEGVGNSDSGSVRCTFDFHALRSGEIGRGPFGGSSFDLVVHDGKIVRVSQDWGIEKFSPQMWEPFAKWVSTAHPKDAAVMYTDQSHTNVRLTEESIRLWDARTREYAEKVGRRGNT